jgi:hypothetical protein
MLKILALTLASVLLPSLSLAQGDDWENWPLGQKFVLAVNAFFPSLTTRIRVDATDGTTGTVLDFEQNLGLSDTETLPSLSIKWRFAKKHSLELGYFELNRSGSAVSVTEIRFGDEVFDIDLPISTFFDTSVLSVGYSYSLLFDAKMELALSAGLSVQDMTFGLRGDTGLDLISESSGVTAPLPAFGISGGYAITDKWTVRGQLRYFSLKLSTSDEDDLEGQIVDAGLGIFHHTFKHVQFGLNYSYFDVAAEFGNENRFNTLDYKYNGPMFTVAAVF